MGSGPGGWVLSFTAILAGGGAVQLLVFVLRRRADLANVDAQSEQIKASIADQLAERLAGEAKRQADRNEMLEKRLDEALDELAACKQELRVARRRIASLEQRIGAPALPRDPSTRTRQDDL